MTIEYVNFRKAFPGAITGHTKWFSINRYFSGKVWYVNFRHHSLVFDFR